MTRPKGLENGLTNYGDRDFAPRHGLDAATLAEIYAWTESDFDQRQQGSPIRRIGHERWLRNIAVALGNAIATAQVVAALHNRTDHPSAVVREHVSWALAELEKKSLQSTERQL